MEPELQENRRHGISRSAGAGGRPIPSQPVKPSGASVARLSGIAFAALLLGAGAAGATSLPPGQGVLATPEGDFAFTVASCGVDPDAEGAAFELRGSGRTPGGEPFHLDLSSGEMTINLGVDKPFATSQRQLRAGRYITKPYQSSVSGLVVAIPSMTLADEAGRPVTAGASLRANCNARD